MGSPLSGILAEIFLQYYEQLTLKNILETKAIINYNRYVMITSSSWNNKLLIL